MGLKSLVRGMTNEDDRTHQKAYKRLRSLSKAEVSSWAQMTADGVYQMLEAYEKDGDPAYLQEARSGALAILAATQVLGEKT